jgi:hypothetical protein
MCTMKIQQKKYCKVLLVFDSTKALSPCIYYDLYAPTPSKKTIQSADFITKAATGLLGLSDNYLTL